MDNLFVNCKDFMRLMLFSSVILSFIIFLPKLRKFTFRVKNCPVRNLCETVQRVWSERTQALKLLKLLYGL